MTARKESQCGKLLKEVALYGELLLRLVVPQRETLYCRVSEAQRYRWNRKKKRKTETSFMTPHHVNGPDLLRHTGLYSNSEIRSTVMAETLWAFLFFLSEGKKKKNTFRMTD